MLLTPIDGARERDARVPLRVWVRSCYDLGGSPARATAEVRPLLSSSGSNAASVHAFSDHVCVTERALEAASSAQWDHVNFSGGVETSAAELGKLWVSGFVHV